MYRKITDFTAEWLRSADGTTKVLESLTDETLDQAVVDGHNSLGWLGWHLATAPVFFAGMAGVNIDPPADTNTVPKEASTILDTYKKVADQIQQQVKQQLTDEQLHETVDSFGIATPRGAILRSLIDHQTHHRGQMTVLLRQAGLPVPGIMGPTKEQSN